MEKGTSSFVVVRMYKNLMVKYVLFILLPLLVLDIGSFCILVRSQSAGFASAINTFAPFTYSSMNAIHYVFAQENKNLDNGKINYLWQTEGMGKMYHSTIYLGLASTVVLSFLLYKKRFQKAPSIKRSVIFLLVFLAWFLLGSIGLSGFLGGTTQDFPLRFLVYFKNPQARWFLGAFVFVASLFLSTFYIENHEFSEKELEESGLNEELGKGK